MIVYLLIKDKIMNKERFVIEHNKESQLEEHQPEDSADDA